MSDFVTEVMLICTLIRDVTSIPSTRTVYTVARRRHGSQTVFPR